MYDLSIHQRVTIGLDALDQAKQVAIRKAIAELSGLTPPPETRPDIRRISPDEPLYLLPVTSDLRVIFRVDESAGMIEVEDIVHREMLLKFSRRAVLPPTAS